VSIINDGLVDEIWAACETNKESFLRGGVQKPIFIIPQCNDFTDVGSDHVELNCDGLFKFYSIFQWTKRKNSEGLVAAYLQEFDESDKVVLVLKTYTNNFADPSIVVRYIENIKSTINKKTFPKIQLICGKLTQRQINNLHEQCDCYVTASRGEGWDMPLTNAMFYKNYIITTKLGGISELLDDSNAQIIPNTFEPVSDMWWIPWYDGSQNWGKIENADISGALRVVFDKRGVCKKNNNYDHILETITKERVGKLMRNRLDQIIKEKLT
jgi:glycosyltransferase involved in cell wall biosynthesis